MTARDWRTRLESSWASLSAREQRGLGLAALVLAAGLLVGFGLWPAIQVLRQAPGEQQRARQQLQTMRQQEARAQQLKALPKAPGSSPASTTASASSPPNSEQALRQTLQPLADTAQLQLSEQRAQVTLKGADPLTVVTWWQQARSQAQAVTQEAQLVRRQVGEQAMWDGTVVMGLAQR